MTSPMEKAGERDAKLEREYETSAGRVRLAAACETEAGTFKSWSPARAILLAAARSLRSATPAPAEPRPDAWLDGQRKRYRELAARERIDAIVEEIEQAVMVWTRHPNDEAARLRYDMAIAAFHRYLDAPAGPGEPTP